MELLSDSPTPVMNQPPLQVVSEVRFVLTFVSHTCFFLVAAEPDLYKARLPWPPCLYRFAKATKTGQPQKSTTFYALHLETDALSISCSEKFPDYNTYYRHPATLPMPALVLEQRKRSNTFCKLRKERKYVIFHRNSRGVFWFATKM